jgi:3-oxoacyl-[acyl-carrier-protein] synthase-1
MTKTTSQRASGSGVRIIGAGICCAVGRSAPAASCALRAGIDHFRESDFSAPDGAPIRVARIGQAEVWGGVRLAHWLSLAIEEAMSGLDVKEHVDIPIVLMCPDAERQLSAEHEQFATVKSLRSALSMRFGRSSKMFAGGRGALARGLAYASALLHSASTTKVLLAGVDSFLNAADVTWYLREERLLVPGNSDGFIPGEGAAALVLERCDHSRPHQKPHGAAFTNLLGVGFEMEEGRPDGSTPSRAQGLSRAIRNAMEEAGVSMNDLSFRISDQNGESFFAKEAANAMTRCAEIGGRLPQVLTTADCTGEIGAATGPLMLAWMHYYLRHPDAPGPLGLLHLASDTGERSAIVVKHVTPGR